MIEFGSDFDLCNYKYFDSDAYFERIKEKRFFACGRHAIMSIIEQEGYKRIWIPAYFCYEIISYIQSQEIEVKLYDDYPLSKNDDAIIKSIPFIDGDVLLRINYFGLREQRFNNLSIPVIEDHTHDLTSNWAINSNADWCIASLRKSLPIAIGGVLWSPKDKKLPNTVLTTSEAIGIAKIRYEGMKIKSEYLRGVIKSKLVFRKLYLESEESINNISISGIDTESLRITNQLNILKLNKNKLNNWKIAYKALSKKFIIITPTKSSYTLTPFSIIIYCKSPEERNLVRDYLIKHSIYPAILWNIPENSSFSNATQFSKRMLSIHCDFRYSKEDIMQMCEIINNYYD